MGEPRTNRPRAVGQQGRHSAVTLGLHHLQNHGSAKCLLRQASRSPINRWAWIVYADVGSSAGTRQAGRAPLSRHDCLHCRC